MLAIDFSIYHHGCLGTESTVKFPEVNTKILSSNPYYKNKVSVVMYAGLAGKNEIARFLHFWRNQNSVFEFNVASRDEHSAIFNVSMTSPAGSVTKVVLDNNGIFSTPVPVFAGLEKWSILLLKERSKPLLFSQLDRLGVAKVNRIKKVEIQKELSTRSTVLSDLSPKQIQVLKKAFENGYFDSPRRISSRELASRIGVAQSTLLEHLRKAQSKLIQKALHHL